MQFEINTRKSPAQNPKQFDRLCSAMGLESMSQVARTMGLDATLISKFRNKRSKFGRFPSVLIELCARAINSGVHPDAIKSVLMRYRPELGDVSLVIDLASLTAGEE
jgi:hypothetical protein